MEMSEAKRIISAYLLGRSVSDQELRTAWRLARSDQGYKRQLLSPAAYRSPHTPDCASFEERVDELAEAPPSERTALFPELVRHMQTCDRCLTLLEDLGPVLEPVAASETTSPAGSARREPPAWVRHSSGAGAVRWRLDVVMRLRAWTSGVVELLAPTPAPLQAVSGLLARGPEPQKWSFEHAETGTAVSLELIRRSASDTVRLKIEATRPPEEREHPSILLFRGAHLAPEQRTRSGPLEVDLRAGRWVVRVERPGHALEVELDVEEGDEEADAELEGR